MARHYHHFYSLQSLSFADLRFFTANNLSGVFCCVPCYGFMNFLFSCNRGSIMKLKNQFLLMTFPRTEVMWIFDLVVSWCAGFFSKTSPSFFYFVWQLLTLTHASVNISTPLFFANHVFFMQFFFYFTFRFFKNILITYQGYSLTFQFCLDLIGEQKNVSFPTYR